ncbi:MAG: MarR family transcriptional regulator [Polyangiaceae bacterium]|nr:MarR family transcriptional regulator [Polyangiaceae bacterium]
MLQAPARQNRTTRTRQGGEQRAVLDGLRRVVRHLRLTARDAERIAGISAAQLFVLQTLATAPAASINELAERTMTDQSSVSVVVRRLVEKKLVVRKTSPSDSRRVGLELSVRGRRLLERCPEPTQAQLLASLGRLSPAELSALSDGMAALVREMGLGTEAPRMFFEETAQTRIRRPLGGRDRDGARERARQRRPAQKRR